MRCLAFFLVILLTLTSVETLKILGIFNHPGWSHFYVFKPLLRALSDKGHDLTVIGYFPEERTLKRYTDITLHNHNVGYHVFDMNFMGSKIQKHLTVMELKHLANMTCELGLTSKEYQDLLKDEHHFDIIISEFFNSNCLLLPFLEKRKIPVIGITSHVLLPWSNDWVGNPDNPAYIPISFLDSSDNQVFIERLESVLALLFNKFYYKYVIEEEESRMFKQYLQKDLMKLREIMYQTSLILVNSHFSLNRPRPLVPNVVEVGGIHVGKIKKITGHIEKWINESTHGVIYFSMGSMIKGHTFPEEKRQMFLRAFGRLPQRVLWKWETETMPGKPDNVMLLKWMPQFDILCHPNVKAFIAHGGLLGVTESVHCGVPMLLMPQFGDQFTNSKAVEANGGGVVLDFRYLTEDQIYEALSTILSADFNKKAKELSARFKDRPMPPLETAIYWVEYVARHRGAPHLRTAAVGMPLYKYLLLDVIAFLATIFFIVAYIWYRIVKAIYRRIFSSAQKVKTN